MKIYRKNFGALLALGFFLFYASGCRQPNASQAGGLQIELAAQKLDENGLDENGNIVFKDSTLQRYLLTRVFNDGNGAAISPEMAAEVGELDLDYREDLGLIKDLSGLEYFTALKSLSARGQGFACADLRANTQLDTLSCEENGQLVAVTLADCAPIKSLLLGACPLLASVRAADLSHLELLDLNGCVSYEAPLLLNEMPKLEFLKLNGIAPAILDITSCPSLVEVYLAHAPEKIEVCLTLQQYSDWQRSLLNFHTNGSDCDFTVI